MINVCFIILNYLAYENAISCIDSIKRQKSTNCNIRIIVVDNFSPNESYKVLKNTYCDESNIFIVQTEKNLGFARGNNYGYKIMREIRFDADYIIMCNDDIILNQEGLYSWITCMYEKYKFAVLGPNVYSVNGNFFQSPSKRYTTNIIKCYKDLVLFRIELLKLKYTKQKNHTKIITWDNPYYMTESDNMTIHGSFQIFSKMFFNYYTEPYDPRTFLYREEDILRVRCDKAKIPMIYSPDYTVNHMQAMSSILDNISSFEKRTRQLKNIICSQKIYMCLLFEKKKIK